MNKVLEIAHDSNGYYVTSMGTDGSGTEKWEVTCMIEGTLEAVIWCYKDAYAMAEESTGLANWATQKVANYRKVEAKLK